MMFLEGYKVEKKKKTLPCFKVSLVLEGQAQEKTVDKNMDVDNSEKPTEVSWGQRDNVPDGSSQHSPFTLLLSWYRSATISTAQSHDYSPGLPAETTSEGASDLSHI